MKRKTLLILFLIAGSFNVFGQNIEIIGGLNHNVFHDYNNSEDHFVSTYKPGLGFCAGIRLDSVKVDWMNMSFALQFDQINGELKARNGGLGYGHHTNAKINKSIISLGIFPLNFSIFRRIDLNIGLEISGLINESITGTVSGWSMGGSNWSSDINEKYSRYCSLICVGLKGRIACDIPVTNTIYIAPQYSYYHGLTKEFDEFPEETRSMRHYFCIGIKKRIK
ncbi:MAG: hypothetical protein K0B15_05595 [Lentimicrobium sp.]|nr:hypothetical protein [Lentimicrobium sp.]